jgi:signal transduction histidine kinase/CheY-like chemotaxis protein
MKTTRMWKKLLSLAQSTVLVLCVIATLIIIYSPLWRSNARADNKFFIDATSVTVSQDSAVRTSYACILAGAASLVLDYVLDIANMIMTAGQANNNHNHSKGGVGTNYNAGRLGSRIAALFIILWPSLHLFCSPHSLSVLELLTDTIMQRYMGLVLIIFFLQGLEKDNPWSWWLLLAAIGSLSVGVILFVVQAYVDSRSHGFIICQFLFEGFSAIAVIWRSIQTFNTYKNRLVLSIALVLYVGHVIMFLLLQSSFDWNGWISFAHIKMAANYLIVAACTLPAVMPARIEREKVIYARKVNEFRQSFIRYISHEIRTPLNVSTVGVAIVEDFLQGKDLLAGEIGEIVEQTKQALSISTEILNDMLTFEKLNANAMVLEQTLERPMDFVMAAAGLFEFQARDKGINFHLPISTSQLDDCFLFIDTYKMSQVIRNLISNALKFTHNGGTIIMMMDIIDTVMEPAPMSSKKTAASTAAVTEWLRISVIDDGVGIAPENIGKLFNEIIQFDANKLQAGKGTGLGMFISRGIVELHGGMIAVQSKGLGHGCTFSVDLPMIRSHLPLELVGVSTKHGSHGSSSQGTASKVANSDNSAKSRVMSVVTTVEDENGGGRSSSQAGNPHRISNVDSTDEEADIFPIYAVALQSPNPSGYGNASALSRLARIDSMGRLNSFNSAIDEGPRSGSRPNSISRPNSVSYSRLSSVSKLDSTRTARKNAFEIMKEVESGRIAVPAPGESHTPSQFSTIDLRDCRVLIVDDSAMNLKMMSLMIKKFGAACIDANNGEQAVNLVQTSMMGVTPHIDIVIMDNNMDIMTGPEACKLMRDAGFTNPIFGLTGDVDEKSDKIYLAAGANRILRKPLKLQEIVDVLTSCSL